MEIIESQQEELHCAQAEESIRSGNSHVTSRPVSFLPHPILGGMSWQSFVSPSRREGPPSILGHTVYWETFPLHSSTMEKSERPEQNQDLRCQSGPSAKDSVIFSGGDSSNNYGADQQRLQISDLHFDKFPSRATFACWKIRFKTEICTCSQFPTEALL